MYQKGYLIETFGFVIHLRFFVHLVFWYIWNLNVPKGLPDNGHIWFYGTFEILVHLVSRYI